MVQPHLVCPLGMFDVLMRGASQGCRKVAERFQPCCRTKGLFRDVAWLAGDRRGTLFSRGCTTRVARLVHDYKMRGLKTAERNRLSKRLDAVSKSEKSVRYPQSRHTHPRVSRPYSRRQCETDTSEISAIQISQILAKVVH